MMSVPLYCERRRCMPMNMRTFWGMPKMVLSGLSGTMGSGM